jgi:hypothetical protein
MVDLWDRFWREIPKAAFEIADDPQRGDPHD